MSLRRTCLFLAILLCTNLRIFGQSEWPGIYSIVSNLCAEWQFEYRELNGLRLGENTIGAMSLGNVVFFDNHTYLFKGKDTVVDRGFWDYNVVQDRVELKEDIAGPLKAVIQPLSPDRLVLIPIVQSGKSQKVFERLRYYYRRQ